MIIYRQQESTVSTASLFDAVAELACRASSHCAVQDLLIRFGELESGVADDSAHDRSVLEIFRFAARALGRLFCCSASGADTTHARMRFERALERARALGLPQQIRVSVPEGYAFYGLFPESYIEAARNFVNECNPEFVCVIGIRSIGASLSAVVSGFLEEHGCGVESYTVRPEGHPFDRRLQFDFNLPQSQFYAVVDEGPGLSGSSFISVTDELEGFGIHSDQIILFPAWIGDASRFVNEHARRAWPRYRKYCGTFDPVSIIGHRHCHDWSAGRWRNALGSDAAVHPHHEARKYLVGPALVKFAGLGSYGLARFERAGTLASAGFAPRALGFDSGFITFEFRTATPRKDSPPLADYLAFRRQAFPGKRSVDFEQMLSMIEVNVSEALGEDAGAVVERLGSYRSEIEDRPAVAVDGRVIPHEWIATAKGWLKADSVDHCSDHFFPGHADIAWDLAGTSVEFRMTTAEQMSLLQRYCSITGDNLTARVHQFYEVAYLAFRLAYVAMAADATSGSADHERFDALRALYASRLRNRLALIRSKEVIAVCR